MLPTTESAINNYFNNKINYKLMEYAPKAADATITYLRYMNPGTQAVQGDKTINQAISAIKRVDGTNKTIMWADGDMAFDNVWANRESLTYKFL